MKNMKIRTKLMISFMISFLLVLVIGTVGMVSLRTMEENTDLLNNRTNIAIMSARLARNIQQQRKAYNSVAAYRLADIKNGIEESMIEIDLLESDYSDLYAQLKAQIKTEESKLLLSKIGSSYNLYLNERDDFFAVIKNDSASSEDIILAMEKSGYYVGELVENVISLTDFINNITDEQAAQATKEANLATVIMVVVIVLSINISVVLSLYISMRISMPLSMMQEVLVQVGNSGSLDFQEKQLEEIREEGENKDEIGQSLNAFSNMIDRFLYISKVLDDVANGDLTTEVNMLSDKDSMGMAIKSMIGKLNNIFEEMNCVADQVFAASHDIAAGAQALAQGNYEQAASVSKISDSVSDIAKRVGEGAGIASDVAKSSYNIRSIAKEGSQKMAKLSVAVQEMRDASHSIEDVIRVIDEIAFNISILAINASVEASYAGEKGKGFAVVAEEVCILANKSAKAAQKTADLVSKNIEKSDIGIAIAEETSESLREIVKGIEGTASLLNTIADHSESSRVCTENVNQAMVQVAKVVRFNSATSEKNSIASDEMSCQADALEQIISKFKLKSKRKSPKIL